MSKQTLRFILSFAWLPILIWSVAVACCSTAEGGCSPSPPQADPNTFNTMVAMTSSAQLTQIAANQPTQNPPPTQAVSPPTSAVTDESAIKQALLIKLGWSEAELEFSMSQNTGQFAQGSLRNVNETGGAAWFAAKVSGQWVIAYIGHGVPNCSEVDPYNIPVDWISHCMDASGATIERASGNAPPPPTTPPPTDVFAPDPLGPAYSGMWISNGMCYDMDVLFHTTDASCDVYLDNGLLTPRNGALFSGYATLTPPSLNHCKGAVLSPDPIAPNSDLYMCFKTNTGKYGFFVARTIETGGISFDAYVFP